MPFLVHRYGPWQRSNNWLQDAFKTIECIYHATIIFSGFLFVFLIILNYRYLIKNNLYHNKKNRKNGEPGVYPPCHEKNKKDPEVIVDLIYPESHVHAQLFELAWAEVKSPCGEHVTCSWSDFFFAALSRVFDGKK